MFSGNDSWDDAATASNKTVPARQHFSNPVDPAAVVAGKGSKLQVLRRQQERKPIARLNSNNPRPRRSNGVEDQQHQQRMAEYERMRAHIFSGAIDPVSLEKGVSSPLQAPQIQTRPKQRTLYDPNAPSTPSSSSISSNPSLTTKGRGFNERKMVDASEYSRSRPVSSHSESPAQLSASLSSLSITESTPSTDSRSHRGTKGPAHQPSSHKIIEDLASNPSRFQSSRGGRYQRARQPSNDPDFDRSAFANVRRPVDREAFVPTSPSFNDSVYSSYDDESEYYYRRPSPAPSQTAIASPPPQILGSYTEEFPSL